MRAIDHLAIETQCAGIRMLREQRGDALRAFEFGLRGHERAVDDVDLARMGISASESEFDNLQKPPSALDGAVSMSYNGPGWVII